MKNLKKILLFLAIFLVIVLAVGAWYVHRINHAALPDYNRNVSLPGLRQPVEVWRDSLGIPHIYAQNEHDLYMATGYLAAQDRLWQMDLIRRVTQGRLSEIFGEKALDADLLLRKLRIPQTSARLWKKLDPAMQQRLEWYAAGVNRYMDDHKDNLPTEFRILNYTPEPWQARQSINLVGYMSWTLELGYKMEAMATLVRQKLGDAYLRDILPHWDENHVLIYPDFHLKKVEMKEMENAMAFIRRLNPPAFEASNNWVIGPRKSATGKPLFSNDMHLHLGLPGIWWRAHLNVPGKMNVTGVLIPGEPFVVAGHNENIAWGMTNVMLDGADFYLEKIDTARKAYLVDGKWRPLTAVREKILIKGRERPLDTVLYFTHRGPVMTKIGMTDVPPVSMRWIGNEDSGEIEALYGFNTARNWDEFRRAAHGFMAVSQNIAYADTRGNIGLQCTGRVPRRHAPGYLFYPGDTSAYDWQGFYPFDSLPYEYNPPRGYVSSANNKTFGDSLYISEWYDLPYRIIRIREMIEAKDKIDTAYIRRMLYDHLSVRARRFLPVINKSLAKARFMDSISVRARRALRQWDGRFEAGRPEPLLFAEFMRQFVRHLTEDEMGPELFKAYYNSFLFTKYLADHVMQTGQSPWIDNMHTSEKESLDDIILLSFRDALDNLEKVNGHWNLKNWGDMHRLHLQHPLGKVKILDKIFGLNRRLPAPGSSNTVNPFSYNLAQPYDSDFGASEKHIYNTADWDASYTILPAGESGMPASPHYDDQMKRYVSGGLFRDPFSLPAVRNQARYHMQFVPE